jgi:hypothetical protein
MVDGFERAICNARSGCVDAFGLARSQHFVHAAYQYMISWDSIAALFQGYINRP